MAHFPMRELLWIAVAWARSAIGRSSVVFAERSCVSMRRRSNFVTCCGSCIRAAPVYIVPRAEGKLVVGATSIESDDRSPASVRGVLELLTSAYSVLPALAEARILEFNTQVRPALPDNLPSLHFDRERKVLRINGLYRHGFLLTPTIVEEDFGFAVVRRTMHGSLAMFGCESARGSQCLDIESSRETQTCLSS